MLIVAESAGAAVHSCNVTIKGLQRFGRLLNPVKSQLVPTQRMVYSRAEFDTLDEVVSLSRDRISRIWDKMRSVGRQKVVTAEVLVSWALSSTIGLTRWVQWQMQPAQQFFLRQYSFQEKRALIRISAKVPSSLVWWLSYKSLRAWFPLGGRPASRDYDRCKCNWLGGSVGSGMYEPFF